MLRALTALIIATLLAFPAAAEQGPEKTVGELYDVLLDSMKRAEELGYAGRYAQIQPVVENTFALKDMAERSTARYWKDLSDEQRETLVDKFEAMTVATYASRFDGYSGQSFVIDGVEDSARGRMLVKTHIVRPNDDDVPLIYVMEQTDGAWKIVDIFLNGKFSEMATRRSEYTAVLKRDGFSGLITALDAKIADAEIGAK
jgi:phospholipid transport system substrate-binding protein|tara:strand:+ start:541 stop:1143 length:603 start_codon:yes stop_codon:yes gene_type:complete